MMSYQSLSKSELDAAILPLCPEDSPAKTLVMPDCEQESLAAAPLWFMNSYGYLKISNQIMQYLRTSPGSAEEALKKCSEKLPRSGMMRNGILYGLGDLERPINVKEYSLLPTLTKFDAGCKNLNGKEYNGITKHALKLGNVIARLPLPTLTCRDYKGATIARVLNGNQKRALDCEMQCLGMMLQPNFAEWHMGYPIGWTARQESNASEMRLSRNKSTRSSKQSQTLKMEQSK